jgi:hypothetical protein
MQNVPPHLVAPKQAMPEVIRNANAAAKLKATSANRRRLRWTT